MTQVFESEQKEKITRIEIALARIDERLLKLEECINKLSVSLSSTYKDQVSMCHRRFADQSQVEALGQAVRGLEERKASKTELYAIKLLVYGAAAIALSSVGYRLVEAVF